MKCSDLYGLVKKCKELVAALEITWDRAQVAAVKAVTDDVKDIGGKIKCAASLEPT